MANTGSHQAPQRSPGAQNGGRNGARPTGPEHRGGQSAAPARPAQQHSGRTAAGKRRKSGKGWRRFLAIYTLLILAIGIAGLVLVYKRLESYEISRPKHVMDALMAESSEEDWLERMLQAPDVAVTEFEDSAEILTGYFDASCRGKAFTYQASSSLSTDDAPAYLIKAGTADVGRVYLTATGDAGFGYHTWAVDRFETHISENSLASATIRIQTPEDTPVYLNGVALGKQYILDGAVPYPELSALESRYAQPPHRVLYEVSGLYGSLTVTDGSGQEIFPREERSEGAVFYDIPAQTYSLKVTAPSAVVVSSCGTPLTETELVSRGDTGVLAGLEQYTGGGNMAESVYAVSGLYRPPEITAADPQGRELAESVSESGEQLYQYAGDAALQAQHQATVEQFFSTYMSYGAGRSAVFGTLLSYILPRTELYSYVKDSTAAMYWASNTVIAYEYLDYYRFVSWGENCFTCRVSYKANLTSQAWYESFETVLEDTYDLAFVQQDGTWYAAAMALAED